MNRFVAIACLLAGCAQGSAERTGADAGDVDAARVDAPDAAPDAPPDACIPATEICNFLDDDCDGMVDEELGLGTPCDGVDTDACIEGKIVCDGSGGTTCSDATSSTVEKCNNLDDDCQNGIDDTFPLGNACTVGLGACARNGVLVCNAAQTGTMCNATAGAPSAEFCGNGIDEDCNGTDAVCPVNDRPAGAIDISVGGTFTADLTTANDDNWAASTPTLDCAEQGGRDVFYQFTLPAEEVVYWDTLGSNFDSAVRVFPGACTSIGAPVACSDDQCSTTRSQGAADLAAGTYCLVVDQFSNNTTAGAATLVFKRGGRPGIALSGTSGTVTGTTAGKTNLSTATCEANSNQPDVGYFWLACGKSYTVSANLCSATSFDSVLYMRSGLATTQTDLACSDDVSGCGSGLQSRISSASVSGPNLMWIIVDGFGSSGNGSYSLSYSGL